MEKRSLLIPVLFFGCLIQVFIYSQSDDFSVKFYNDLRGYHAVGTSRSENKEEAIRIAKSEAIKYIFSETGKDKFFQEMFISVFPQFIILEASQLDNSENGYIALVKVVIDQNAIIMLEEQYADAVFDLVNQGEIIIAKIDQLLQKVENSELNLRMSEAMLLYKSGEVHCQEIEELFKDINNSNVRSAKGNSIPVLKKLNESLRFRVNEGVGRLEKMEQDIERDSALEELVKTLELILSEIGNIELVLNSYSNLQPFYDLPKSQLKNIRIDLETAIDKTKIIDTKLKTLGTQIPENRLLMKEKVSISSNDLNRLMNKLRNMKKDVDQEIRYPRLVRQQHAQNWKKMTAETGEVMKYVFLHQPKDILAARFYSSFQWPEDEKLILTDDIRFYIRAEKAFNAGFWIKTQYYFQNVALLNINQLQSASQELAMGYFRDTIMFGASLSWDWMREISQADSTKEKVLKIYFGGIDKQRLRADWLVSMNYQFPHFISPFLPAYQINGGLDLLLRIEDLLLIEASVDSGTVQNSLPGADGLSLENYQYGFSWRLGLGLRFPGPMVWGVYYNYNNSAQVNNPSASENWGTFQTDKYWGAFLEYSF